MNTSGTSDVFFVEERQAVVALLTALHGLPRQGGSAELVEEMACSIADGPDAVTAVVLLARLALEGLESIVAETDMTVEEWLQATALDLASA